MLAELGGDRLRRGAGVAGDGEVEVGDLPPQRRVADGAADDPDPLAAAERPPWRRPTSGAASQALGEAHAARRGTRAEIPQVTS